MKYSQHLKENNVKLPAAFVDLEAFDQNVQRVAETLKGLPFTVRVATKSIRVPELIKRVLDFGAPYKGLMCYSAEEALFLSQHGFDDFLVAYPTLAHHEIEGLVKLCRDGKKVSLVCDDWRQIEVVQKISAQHLRAGQKFSVLLEIDLSVRLGPLVLGVRRSPLRDIDAVLGLIRKIQSLSAVQFSGFMAYEAHVAGVGDQNPFKKALSFILKPFRRWSMKKVVEKRKALFEACRNNQISFEIFNGGGTGSTQWHNDEAKVLTEVTVGSGFLCSHLFDYYSNFQPIQAGFFALQAVRQPEEGWYTCSGGGYVASGEPGLDRLPRPLEAEMSLSGFEGTGEVQTPVQTKNKISLGDPIVFRPAKAGEWLERFNEVHLFEKGRHQKSVKTYRGFGQCYF